MVSKDGDASIVQRSSSSSCLRSSNLLTHRPACLVSRIESVDWVSTTCRRPRAVVLNYAESTKTHCCSELRGVGDHSLLFCTGVDDDYVLLFWPALLINTRCAVLTSVADKHVPFWPALLINVADDPVRWRWRTAGSTWSSNGPVTVPLIVDD